MWRQCLLRFGWIGSRWRSLYKRSVVADYYWLKIAFLGGETSFISLECSKIYKNLVNIYRSHWYAWAIYCAECFPILSAMTAWASTWVKLQWKWREQNDNISGSKLREAQQKRPRWCFFFVFTWSTTAYESDGLEFRHFSVVELWLRAIEDDAFWKANIGEMPANTPSKKVRARRNGRWSSDHQIHKSGRCVKHRTQTFKICSGMQ